MGYPSVHLDPFTAEIKTQTDAVGVAEAGNFYYQRGSLFMFVQNTGGADAVKGEVAYLDAVSKGVGHASTTVAGDPIGIWCRAVPDQEWGFVLVQGPGIEGGQPWVPIADAVGGGGLGVSGNDVIAYTTGLKVGQAWTDTADGVANAYFNFMPH